MKSSPIGSLAMPLGIAGVAAALFLWKHQKPPPAPPAAAPAAAPVAPVPATPTPTTAPTTVAKQVLPPSPAPDWWARLDYPISAEVLADGRVRWRGKLFDLSQFIAGVTELVRTRPPVPPARPANAPVARAVPTVQVLSLNFGERTVNNPSDQFAFDTIVRALTPVLMTETGLPVSQGGSARIVSLRMGGGPGGQGSVTAPAAPLSTPAYGGSGAVDIAEAVDAADKHNWIGAYNSATQAMTKEVLLNGAPRNDLPWIVAFQAASTLRDLPRLLNVIDGYQLLANNANDAKALAATRPDIEQWIVDDSKRDQRPATAASNPRFIFGVTVPTETGRSIIGLGRAEIAWFADTGGGRLGAGVLDSDQVNRPPVPVEATPPELPERLAKGATPTLTLELIVSDAGTVLAAWPVGTSDPELEHAAVRAVSKWKFQPATKDGKPVTVRTVLPVTFWEK